MNYSSGMDHRLKTAMTHQESDDDQNSTQKLHEKPSFLTSEVMYATSEVKCATSEVMWGNLRGCVC